MEAVAHPAAVESLIGELLFEVLQNFVVLLLIEVLGRSLGVVVTELDGNIVLPPALGILRELVRGIVLVEHAVDALGRGDSGHDLVGRFLDVALQMARNVDAGDLVRVAAGEVDHLLRAAAGLHGERGVDIHLVRPGDRVEHPLQVTQLGEGLTAGENEVAFRRDGVHHGNGPQNRLDAEAGAVGIFLFIDTERAVVAAVIRHKNRDRGASFARLIGMSH